MSINDTEWFPVYYITDGTDEPFELWIDALLIANLFEEMQQKLSLVFHARNTIYDYRRRNAGYLDRKSYEQLKEMGMLFELFPASTGNYDDDCAADGVRP